MAHMIENNMIAYRGETPWHGLGFQVDENATGADMLRAAGLNWKVQRRSLAMKSTDGALVLTEELNGYKAIVRSDTNFVFGVPTKRYEVVQNEQIVDLFREYCEAGHAKMETVGALRNGAVVWALAKLNGGTAATLKGNDKMNGYILFSTSHDGTLSTVGKATSVRVVCHNTMNAALKGGVDFKVKHSAKWTEARADEAKAKLGMASEQIQQFHAAAEKLSNVNIDQQGRVEYISRLANGKCLLEQVVENSTPVVSTNMLDAAITATTHRYANPEDCLNRVGKAILEAIIDSPGSNMESAKNTLWGAVNGVSYYTDHVAGRTQDSRLSNAWFGQNDELKRSAMQVAIEMAGVTV
jgi:phage/plasmid-like protein (TIGR03299 family)